MIAWSFLRSLVVLNILTFQQSTIANAFKLGIVYYLENFIDAHVVCIHSCLPRYHWKDIKCVAGESNHHSRAIHCTACYRFLAVYAAWIVYLEGFIAFCSCSEAQWMHLRFHWEKSWNFNLIYWRFMGCLKQSTSKLVALQQHQNLICHYDQTTDKWLQC